MSVLLLFFDGVGIAPPNPETNPITFFQNHPFPVQGSDYDYFSGKLMPTDPRLGVDGLPQSATGQTTILTGRNGAKIQGRHVNAFPTTKLRQVITESSVLKRIKFAGKRPVFANAYHPGYFARRHSRFSVSTWSWLAAGIEYHSLDDLQVGNAVSHDLTNRFMNRFGFGVTVRRPAQTGRILAQLLERYDFVLFEYILTDVFGHRQDFDSLKFRLAQIAEMTDSLFESTDLRRHTILLTSDHGNSEDLSTNTHTLNLVPTILWAEKSVQKKVEISSLLDITPTILELLEISEANGIQRNKTKEAANKRPST